MLVSQRLPPYNRGMEKQTEKTIDPVAEFILEALAESGSAAPVDIAVLWARCVNGRVKRPMLGAAS